MYRTRKASRGKNHRGRARLVRSMTNLQTKPKPLDVDFRKSTIIIVDMQNAFASKGGMSDIAGADIFVGPPRIDSNLLAGLRGPRIGVLVSKGHEKDLYGKDPRSSVLGRLLTEKDVIGVNGSLGGLN